MMEMAKVTSKGQITIPISIRRRLSINEGDKILFINKQDGVLMVNPDSVQGEMPDYAAQAVPLESSPAVSGQAAAAAPQPAATPPAPVPVSDVPSAAASEPSKFPQPAATPAAQSLTAPEAATPPVSTETVIEPPRRKYIPPVEEVPVTKPAAVGDLDLGSLLDDIRSIGSNI